MQNDELFRMINICKNKLNTVFGSALSKYSERNSKNGNSIAPWTDFSIERLEERLQEEIEEYKNEKVNINKAEELLDIINLSAFIYLARTKYLSVKST